MKTFVPLLALVTLCLACSPLAAQDYWATGASVAGWTDTSDRRTSGGWHDGTGPGRGWNDDGWNDGWFN